MQGLDLENKEINCRRNIREHEPRALFRRSLQAVWEIRLIHMTKLLMTHYIHKVLMLRSSEDTEDMIYRNSEDVETTVGSTG